MARRKRSKSKQRNRRNSKRSNSKRRNSKRSNRRNRKRSNRRTSKRSNRRNSKRSNRRNRSNSKRRNNNRRNEMRKLIQKIPQKKLTKLIQGRVFGDDIKQQLSIVKEMPEKYFTMDELVKYSKEKKSRKRKIGGSARSAEARMAEEKCRKMDFDAEEIERAQQAAVLRYGHAIEDAGFLVEEIMKEKDEMAKYDVERYLNFFREKITLQGPVSQEKITKSLERWKDMDLEYFKGFMNGRIGPFEEAYKDLQIIEDSSSGEQLAKYLLDEVEKRRLDDPNWLLLPNRFWTKDILSKYINKQKYENNLYAILGLDNIPTNQSDFGRDVNADEIEKAWRKSSKQFEPGDGSEYAKKMLEAVNEAYEILSDPDKKIVYDNYGYNHLAAHGPNRRPPSYSATAHVGESAFYSRPTSPDEAALIVATEEEDEAAIEEAGERTVIEKAEASRRAVEQKRKMDVYALHKATVAREKEQMARQKASVEAGEKVVEKENAKAVASKEKVKQEAARIEDKEEEQEGDTLSAQMQEMPPKEKKAREGAFSYEFYLWLKNEKTESSPHFNDIMSGLKKRGKEPIDLMAKDSEIHNIIEDFDGIYKDIFFNEWIIIRDGIMEKYPHWVKHVKTLRARGKPPYPYGPKDPEHGEVALARAAAARARGSADRYEHKVSLPKLLPVSGITPRITETSSPEEAPWGSGAAICASAEKGGCTACDACCTDFVTEEAMPAKVNAKGDEVRKAKGDKQPKEVVMKLVGELKALKEEHEKRQCDECVAANCQRPPHPAAAGHHSALVELLLAAFGPDEDDADSSTDRSRILAEMRAHYEGMRTSKLHNIAVQRRPELGGKTALEVAQDLGHGGIAALL